jgi:hypothetical protein
MFTISALQSYDEYEVLGTGYVLHPGQCRKVVPDSPEIPGCPWPSIAGLTGSPPFGIVREQNIGKLRGDVKVRCL